MANPARTHRVGHDLIVIRQSSDNTFKVTVKRKGKFLTEVIGFATVDYAYNYGLRLLLAKDEPTNTSFGG